MKSIAAEYCVILVTLLFASAIQAQDRRLIVDAARPSVLQLSVGGLNAVGNAITQRSLGSGFVIYSDSQLKQTFVATAAHVLGTDDAYQLDETKRVIGRQIRILRQRLDTDEMVVITERAELVGKNNQDSDVAILAIPLQDLPSLQIGSSTGVGSPDSVALLGFPAGGRFTSTPMSVSRTDLNVSLVVLTNYADEGQSGGPVLDLDAGGRVVAIISENDDRQRPHYHHAVLISGAVSILNSYLNERGRPMLEIQNRRDADRFSVVGRTGDVIVEINGTGGGALEAGKTDTKQITAADPADVRATGSEVSDCEAELGRTISRAQAVASVKPFENTGTKVSAELEVHGGHYRSATTCLAGKPVGLVDHDTNATASLKAKSVIEIQARVAQFAMRLIWQGMPIDSTIALLDPLGAVRAELSAAGSGEQLVDIDELGVWRISSSLSEQIEAQGSVEFRKMARRAVIFLEASEKPQN